MEVNMDGNVTNVKTLGESMGLSLKREKEICKLTGEKMKKLKDAGNFDKSKVIFELQKERFTKEELYFALFMAGFYSAIIETPRVVFVNEAKQRFASSESQIMYG